MLVDTPRGIARLTVDRAATAPRGLLVLGHGAGGSIGTADLSALAAHAPQYGITVVRVEQPYRVLGRRAPPPAAHLDQAWTAAVAIAVEMARERTGPELPLVVGGRSSGARVAARTTVVTGTVGLLALAFPLISPSGASRQPELDAVGVPVLVLQGDRDRFGVPDPAPGRTVHVLPGVDHALRGVSAEVVTVTMRWLDALLAGRDGP